MSNDRLDIWDAKHNLSYNEPLSSNSDLFVDIAPARGEFKLKRLYRQLHIDNNDELRQPPRKDYTLFTGHRGCGKSTELLRVSDYLHNPSRYFVIHLDCLERLDINNLKYSDVLLALATRLLETLQEVHGIHIDDIHLYHLEQWFAERVETHADIRNFSAEIKAGVKAEVGLPWVAKIFAELTNKINIGASYRNELRQVLKNNFSEFASAFNSLIIAAEEQIQNQNLGKRILFTVDGTDRLNSEDAHEFFIDDVHQLTQINGIFIYCAPIHLLHEDNQLNANFATIFRVPMLKIRDRDDNPIPENINIVREMVERRVPSYLFDTNATVDHIIKYSGGHARDLLRLLNLSITFSEEDVITLDAADSAIKQIANDYRRTIEADEYEHLVKIDLNPETPEAFTNEDSTKMLYNLVLLEYNDYFWKSHPVIQTLPGYQKALDTARNP